MKIYKASFIDTGCDGRGHDRRKELGYFSNRQLAHNSIMENLDPWNTRYRIDIINVDSDNIVEESITYPYLTPDRNYSFNERYLDDHMISQEEFFKYENVRKSSKK